MKDPPHSPREPFEKAADATEAWRYQQIAALTENQRALYDRACKESDERIKAKAAELEKRRQSDINEALRKRSLAKPQLNHNPRIRGATLQEILATGQTGPGKGSPAAARFHAFADKHELLFVKAQVDSEHKRELDQFIGLEREGLDSRLRDFEQARGVAGAARDAMGKAGARDRARTDFAKSSDGAAPLKSDAIARAIAKVQQKEKTRGDFQQAAGKTAEAEPPVKSDPIARAIAKVKAKEEEQRAAGDRERDTGRSLSDTFNRVR